MCPTLLRTFFCLQRRNEADLPQGHANCRPLFFRPLVGRDHAGADKGDSHVTATDLRSGLRGEQRRRSPVRTSKNAVSPERIW